MLEERIRTTSHLELLPHHGHEGTHKAQLHCALGVILYGSRVRGEREKYTVQRGAAVQVDFEKLALIFQGLLQITCFSIL